MPQLVYFIYQMLSAVLQRDYVGACRNFRRYSALAAVIYYGSVFLMEERLLAGIVQATYITLILVPFLLRVLIRLMQQQRVVERACGWTDYLSDGVMIGTLVHFFIGSAFPPVLGFPGEAVGWVVAGSAALAGAWVSYWFSRPRVPTWSEMPKVPKVPKRRVREKREAAIRQTRSEIGVRRRFGRMSGDGAVVRRAR